MKRILTSVGLMALGASALQAQYAPGLSAIERTKPWSISASLRGFYDDNYVTAYQAVDSFGLDFSPSASFNHSTENTLIGASYVYDLKHYEGGVDDQTHQLNGKFDHAFSERYKLSLNESFVIGQEPEILSGSGVVSTPYRIEGDNLRNAASASFLAEMTQLLGLELRYGNTLYSYDNEQYSARLDRMEQLVGLDLRWHVTQQTTGIFGYQFGDIDYNSGKYLSVFDPALNLVRLIPSTVRNQRSHYLVFGVDHAFTSNLNGSLRVGPQFVEFYNLNEFSPIGSGDDSTVSPYVDASVSYTYMEGSYAQLGIKQVRNASDQFGAVNPILDEESTVPYFSITHKITPKLTGSLMAQWQHAVRQGTSFIGGLDGANVNDTEEDFIYVNLNLAYQFTPYLMAEAGYDLSNLSSDVNFRGYKRNIGYLGVRATY